MIKRLFVSTISAIMAMMLFCGVALAAWEFLFPINVVDTSNVTRTYYPVMLGFGGQPLVDAGKIASNGTDTNMQIGSTSIKYMMSTTNVTAVIPTLPAGGVSSLSLYTGYDPVQSGFPIITGSGGYVAVTDNASIDIAGSDNFSIGVSGWLHTDNATGKYLVNKEDVIRILTSETVSGNVSAQILGTATVTMYPDGVGDFTNIPSVQPPATPHWQVLDEPGAPNDADHVFTIIVHPGAGDRYTLQNPALAGTLVGVNSVTVYWRCSGGAVASAGTPILRLGGIDNVGTEVNYGVSGYTTRSEVLGRPGGGTWTATDLNDLQVGIDLESDGASGSYCSWLYVVVSYDYIALQVSATGVSTNRHAVDVWTDAVSFGIDIDGVTVNSTALGGVSIIDNASEWVFCTNDIMPYADNITLSVNGTQVLYLSPTVMLSGAIVPDRAGYNHYGTIHWGSNSNLFISYGEMTSYESYIASISTTGGYDMPTAAMPETWFAAGENVANLPFYDAISAVSVQTGVPAQVYYLWAIIGVAFGVFLFLTMFTRSALLGYIAMVGIFGIGSTMTIVPAWIVFTMIIIGLAIMYLYKQVAY